jgi:hypothetical protein
MTHDSYLAVGGLVLFQQLLHHVVEDEDGFGGKPVLVSIGGAALRARMVRAEDKSEESIGKRRGVGASS